MEKWDKLDSKKLDKLMNSKEELASEIIKTEQKLKELRNLQQETRSNIFVESSFLRILQDRLDGLEKRDVSNDTRPERN